MSETYMITAKTVEEAIAIANREYADENHEVSYEIIDMPKKGFLGIGAKNAKIKITVNQLSSEFDSIVADLRDLKVLTAKGDSGERRGERKNGDRQKKRAESEKQPNQNAKQPAMQSKQQKTEKQSEKAQNGSQQHTSRTSNGTGSQEHPNQKTDRQQKNAEQGNAQPKAQQKPAQQRQENKPVRDNKPTERQNDRVNEKQNAKAPEKSAKPVGKTNTKPVEQRQPRQEKLPVKNDTAAEAAPVQEAAVESAVPSAKPTEPVTTHESRSSLRNQAKPGKRQPQKHGTPEQNIPASSITVSDPMSLTDFVSAENNDSFGYANDGGKAAGRMNNDVRRSRKNAPKQQETEKKVPFKTPKPDRRGERIIYEDRQSMSTRYDVAESDEDYLKLDNLEDRELTIDEIRQSVKVNKESDAETVRNVEDVDVSDVAEVVSAPEKTVREAVSETEMSFALAFANTLLKNMQLKATALPAECPENEEFVVTEECTVYPKINIIGEDTGILIGHHGETLDAIQYLVNLSALRQSKQKDGDYVKIVVDIENYREKREETLRALARRMAARAIKYKRNVFLEPMNAYERRIIHSELQNVENVSTHSVGADRDRKIIITYEGADKVPDNRRRKGQGHNRNNGGAVSPSENDARENNTSVSREFGESRQDNGANRERRRPRKVQKMPIEKIGEILPDSEGTGDASAESEE